MTVEEASALLRVSLNTVYRWCRAGRLPAKKVGRDWRISTSTLHELGHPIDPKPMNLLDPLLPHLAEGHEHLFSLVFDGPTELRLQTLFLEVAFSQPDSAVYLGLWDESPDMALSRLRATVAPGRSLRFLNLAESYVSSGLQGALKEMEAAIERTNSDHQRFWFASSPQRFFGANMERLLEFERELHRLALANGAMVLCSYESASTASHMAKIGPDLLSYHSGFLWFDGLRTPHLFRMMV